MRGGRGRGGRGRGGVIVVTGKSCNVMPNSSIDRPCMVIKIRRLLTHQKGLIGRLKVRVIKGQRLGAKPSKVDDGGVSKPNCYQN